MCPPDTPTEWWVLWTIGSYELQMNEFCCCKYPTLPLRFIFNSTVGQYNLIVIIRVFSLYSLLKARQYPQELRTSPVIVLIATGIPNYWRMWYSIFDSFDCPNIQPLENSGFHSLPVTGLRTYQAIVVTFLFILWLAGQFGIKHHS